MGSRKSDAREGQRPVLQDRDERIAVQIGLNLGRLYIGDAGTGRRCLDDKSVVKVFAALDSLEAS